MWAWSSDLSDFDGVALHPVLARPTGPARPPATRWPARACALPSAGTPDGGLKPGSTLHSRLLRAAAELAAACPCKVQVGSFDAMCAMIAAGMGVGIMPRAASLPYLDALRLTATPLDESWAEHQLYLCRKADGEFSCCGAAVCAPGGLASQHKPAGDMARTISALPMWANRHNFPSV